MRLDPSPTRPDHPEPTPASASRLDQVWAATRPEPPAPELLDALWAHASAELDRLALVAEAPPRGQRPASSPTRSQPRWWAGPSLAAAAVVLLGAGLALRVGSQGSPGSPTPLAATHPLIDVGVDQTLVVRLDADGPRVDLQAVVEPPLASNTLADNTQHDIFNAWESCATP